jgi:hypothetical protein
VHTFTVDDPGTALDGPSASSVEFADGAFIAAAPGGSGFAAVTLGPGGIVTPFSLTTSGGVTGSLSQVNYNAFGGGSINYIFTGTNGPDFQLLFSAVYGPSFVRIDLPGGDLLDYSGETGNGAAGLAGTSMTGSLTVIPEPSALGFGALALGLVGVGRWFGRRFSGK